MRIIVHDHNDGARVEDFCTALNQRIIKTLVEELAHPSLEDASRTPYVLTALNGMSNDICWQVWRLLRPICADASKYATEIDEMLSAHTP